MIKMCPDWQIGLRASLLLSWGMLGFGQAASAQHYLDYYSVKNAGAMSLDWRAFYESAMRETRSVRANYRHVLDLPYGTERKQALDLYLPKRADRPAPIVLFIHGGSFLEGDRADYGFVARPFLEQGAIVAVMSYRLTESGARFPAQLDDAKNAVRWLHANGSRYGGDISTIIVVGHSAGAILAAELGVDRSWMPLADVPKEAIRAIVGISGKYRLGPGERLFGNYVPDADAERLASPILHIDDPAPLFVLGVGSTETAYLNPTIRFFETLQDHGVGASLYVANGRNHQEILNEFADRSSPLIAELAPLLGSAPTRR